MASIKDQLTVDLREEGVDHVNVSVFSQCNLGKMLSPDWRKKFYIPHVGDFGSARAFANWIISGGDESLRLSAKFYRTHAPVNDFRTLVLFAKYYQLYSMRGDLINANKLFAKPWVMYKQHLSGIREMDIWTSYTAQMRELAEDIVKENTSPNYDWENKKPNILGCVNHYLAKIAQDGFIPFEQLNQVAKEHTAERARALEEKRKNRETLPKSADVKPDPVAPLMSISEPSGDATPEVECPVAAENC